MPQYVCDMKQKMWQVHEVGLISENMTKASDQKVTGQKLNRRSLELQLAMQSKA